MTRPNHIDLLKAPEYVTYELTETEAKKVFEEVIRRRYGVDVDIIITRDEEVDALYVAFNDDLPEEVLETLDGLHPDEWCTNAQTLIAWLFGIPACTVSALAYESEGELRVVLEVPYGDYCVLGGIAA